MNKGLIGLIITGLIFIATSAEVDAQNDGENNACIGCHTSVGVTKGIINAWI